MGGARVEDGNAVVSVCGPKDPAGCRPGSFCAASGPGGMVEGGGRALQLARVLLLGSGYRGRLRKVLLVSFCVFVCCVRE